MSGYEVKESFKISLEGLSQKLPASQCGAHSRPARRLWRRSALLRNAYRARASSYLRRCKLAKRVPTAQSEDDLKVFLTYALVCLFIAHPALTSTDSSHLSWQPPANASKPATSASYRTYCDNQEIHNALTAMQGIRHGQAGIWAYSCACDVHPSTASWARISPRSSHLVWISGQQTKSKWVIESALYKDNLLTVSEHEAAWQQCIEQALQPQEQEARYPARR